MECTESSYYGNTNLPVNLSATPLSSSVSLSLYHSDAAVPYLDMRDVFDIYVCGNIEITISI